jgi:cob(I)alamin adenosyltransferase
MTEYSTRLYTRTGDTGITDLMGPGRVAKDSRRLQALGDLDEVNSQLGVVRALSDDVQLDAALQEVQNLLFECGRELAQPTLPRLTAAHTAGLEQLIDRLQESLPPLKRFILPGGTAAAAHCHLARAVCRRAERILFHLARSEPVNGASLQFINRLSDLLFVVARTLNQRAGGTEVLWRPRT